MKETRKFTAEFFGVRKTFHATEERWALVMAQNYFRDRFALRRFFRRGEVKITEWDA